jgi:nitroreductase
LANYSTLETIRRRRSVRRYSPKPVEEEKILALLDAARLAPSSSNTQPWHFIVVRNPDTINKIRNCVPAASKPLLNDFVKTAPVVIVACGVPTALNHFFTSLFGINMLSVDVAIAVEHIVLTATELDLGTCWIGWFSAKKLKRLLGIPLTFKVVALVTVGYPENPSTPDAIGGVKAKSRKPLEEICSFEFYGTPRRRLR